ncbi:MAG: hypothetical protein SFX72_06655 [Isosphaeraceae bacterium]|nr:hypothetical protein [Isosphaeraceae bacterium]
MDFREIERLWNEQHTDPDAADPRLDEIQRLARDFQSTILRRDVREVGTAVLLVPVWIALGVRLTLPWTWYLMVPALVWVGGYLCLDRIQRHRRRPDAGATLRGYLEAALSEVDHQVALLSGVFRWALLPVGLAASAFLLQIGWMTREDGWVSWLVVACCGAIAFAIMRYVIVLNRRAVETELLPHRSELASLLMGIDASEISGI